MKKTEELLTLSVGTFVNNQVGKNYEWGNTKRIGQLPSPAFI